MKRLLFYILILFFVHIAAAQQRPQYTQYVFNNFLLNPAVTGIENYTDVKAGYRSQWTGLNGAPVTSYLTINAPLGREFIEGSANSFSAGGGENPNSRLYTQDYMAAAPHHGIGAMVVTDKAGPITTTNFDATYAYHLGLTDRLNLSVGVAAGFMRTNLNTSEITLETALDPAIANGNNGQFHPDLGLGMWLYSSNYYFGISAQQILPQSLYLKSTSIDVIKTVPHYFFTAGVKLFVSDDITLMPSVLVKQIKPVPLTYDVNMKLAFRDNFWIGGSYRHGDSFGAMTGFYLNSFLNVGYSYDITTSALNTVSSGTHELVIGILLNNRYKVTCPRYGF
ncbi:MAG: type IX secretion system membrane protein PorP/SprF [Mucilaginibacter sp.]